MIDVRTHDGRRKTAYSPYCMYIDRTWYLATSIMLLSSTKVTMRHAQREDTAFDLAAVG